ncbi:hypothetical protein RHSIM_Rhsim04G0112800 [Rhododendron simsii]|uniref:Uncharacterized protein n=1 Tax=Rhododendron simsii TaxID=118357 RepID=A0A834HBE3_RHOSS|nr:hypothetical protein RHSIM_Rhsim04G0112800 [Rhododendron simsii]
MISQSSHHRSSLCRQETSFLSVLEVCFYTTVWGVLLFFFGQIGFRVGLNLPTIEVRFKKLSVGAENYVGSRALPTILNFTINMLEGLFSHLPNRKKPITILNDVSGNIKPGS